MTTRSQVLEALRSAGDAGLSGQEIAARLGVSRVAVSKHVAVLRNAGYEIQAAPGVGYRLVGAPDLPLPDEEVAHRLTSALWTELAGGAETGSTNDDARVLARAGAVEGSVVLAARQRTGRGRMGRTWESPTGGVYLSAVLRPAVAPTQVASLALAVALGVVVGLERLGVQPQLKWPNDVLLGGRKLAGVLLEMSAEADAVQWVVAGVGLNVHRPAPGAAGALEAAYLDDAVTQPRLAEVAAAELDGIADTYAAWRTGGFSAVRAAYEARFALTGADVCVSDLTGAVRASGIVEGVDDEGRLLLRGADGTIAAVVAGEVTLRR